MINITISGETITIKEKTELKNLIAVDCYVGEQVGDKTMLPIPELPDRDIAKRHLYVAGIVTADNLGDMETITDEIIFEGLTWDDDWAAWLGVYIKGGDIASLDNKAGIKVFFGGESE